MIFEAYRLLHTGRPGPVLIDFPENVQVQKSFSPTLFLYSSCVAAS